MWTSGISGIGGKLETPDAAFLVIDVPGSGVACDVQRREFDG
jgi:hypothetical protein